ncbi:hypothetical protein [Hymenobacter glacieicola]|nr:hypothetical protein [Hymenobacter glacieicola]
MLLLLGVDLDWLTWLRMENMVAWLCKEYGDGSYRNAIASSPEFKTWWLAQWASRDAALSSRIKVLNTGVMTHSVSPDTTHFIHEQEEFRELYVAYHDPLKMTKYPDREIINEIIKTARKAA